MEKCKLCKINDLDNTGAHLVTESIVRSTLSEEGTSGRDNEIIYSLSGLEFGNRFIGRKISEEKVIEIQGSELSEQQIQENKNPIVDFNLVCRPCENKFNPIETYFMQNTKPAIENHEGPILTLDSKHYKVSLLFIIINLWRLAKSDKKDFEVADDFLEELRLVINKIAKKTIDETLLEIDFNNGILSRVKFSMIYMKHNSGHKSANSVLLGSNLTPIFMILGQFIFIVFFDYSKNMNYKIPSIICDITSKNKIRKQIERRPNELVVHFISDANRQLLNKKIFNHEVKKFKIMVDKKLSNWHLEIYGIPAPLEAYRMVYYKISLLKKSLALETIDDIIATVLYDCGAYYRKTTFPNNK